MRPPAIPQRSSLVSQTSALLEEGIRTGRWRGTLPGQHALCRLLVISRTTLRPALQDLARRGWIELGQGRATRIRQAAQRPPDPRRLDRAVLLLPEPLWRLRPSVAHWAAALGPLLLRSGLDLVVEEGGVHDRAQPAARLERLVRAHPRSAWVLFSSTLAMQQWFAAQGLPTILVGAAFPGVGLPSIEYDHAAIAQHAGTTLAAAGHRRTAILLQRTGSAADATTCAAFGAARSPGTPEPLLIEHDGSMAQLESRLQRFAALRQRPTALFVTKTLAVPAVLTVLGRAGLAVPRDVSVICREDDPFLDFLSPSVARYRSDSAAIARKLAVGIARLANGQRLKVTHERLMPRFIPGHSITRPAGT